MKLALSKTRALVLGVALIVVTNAVVLAGVAYNRSGELASVLKLTERELSVRDWSWPENDNSSIDLHLDWRVAPGEVDEDGYERDYGLYWLSSAQLHELGFDVVDDVESEQGMERVNRQPSRRAWLALEYQGPAYQATLGAARKRVEHAAALAQANAGDSAFEERLHDARDDLAREERWKSRLFVIDAGRNAEALRKKYPDPQRYAIVHGRLGVFTAGPNKHNRMVAQVLEIDAGTIRVPHAYRGIVEPLIDASYTKHEPRFAATVNFGRLAEPWIVDLAPLK